MHQGPWAAADHEPGHALKLLQAAPFLAACEQVMDPLQGCWQPDAAAVMERLARCLLQPTCALTLPQSPNESAEPGDAVCSKLDRMRPVSQCNQAC